MEHENDELRIGLKKTKQGTIRHFLTKPINFRARSSVDDGGGSLGGGVDGMVDVSRWREPDEKSCNDALTKRVFKTKAVAKNKRKRGAKSATGKGPGMNKGSDSSQQTIMGFLICEERPVGVRNSLGSKPIPTNTS